MKTVQAPSDENSEPGSARKLTSRSGSVRRARSTAACSGRATGGPGGGAANCRLAACARQAPKTKESRVLIAPLSPTTANQTSSTMPSRLCRSSMRSSRERGLRTVPNGVLRMKPPYSATPETSDTSSSAPMTARIRLPGRPSSMSVCSRNNRAIGPPWRQSFSLQASPVITGPRASTSAKGFWPDAPGLSPKRYW